MKYKGVEISTYTLYDQISGHWIGKYDLDDPEHGHQQYWTHDCFDSEDDAMFAAANEARHSVDQMK